MFEGIVAHLLNKYLGKYIDDLDSEQLNVGIFSGTVHLTDLHLKPEALADLDLPIEVKQGCIAKMSIDIPWTSLYYEPVLVHIEEILVLAGPVADRRFDTERDKRLSRARKRKRLADAEHVREEDVIGEKPQGFVESLATTVINNIQISIQNVHIRYEDTVSSGQRQPLACGLVLQNVTAITTNHKWKAAQIDSDAKNIFKLLKVESLSLYWNPCVPTNTLVRAQLHTNGWKTLLRKGLATFSINGEDFDFVLKPVSFKIKMILNKSKEAKVPKLLLDFVLQDAVSQLSREQFLSMYAWNRAINAMEVNLRYRKYFNGNPVKGHASEWWHNAYAAVRGEYVEPYTWAKIREHRNKYRRYKSLYKEFVHKPNDTELRLDLQLQEDTLDITNILLAREQARMELAKEEPDIIKKVSRGKSYWSSWFGDDTDETDSTLDEINSPVEESLIAIGEKDKSWWSRMTSEERERLFEGIGYEKNSPEADVPVHYIAHKFNFTLANCTMSLLNSSREILVVTVTHFLSSFETRPGARAFKFSARTESFVVEGASVENDLVPILTSDNITSGSNAAHVFALDLEKSPLQVEADYGLTIVAEPMEVIYHKHAVNELIAFIDLPKPAVNHFKAIASEKLQEFSATSKATIIAALNKRKTVHLNIDLKSPYFVIPEHGSLQQNGSILVIDTGRLTVNSDLQADSVLQEDATKMEVEERLYDRFTVALSDAQVLFSDPGKQGDDWRAAKQTAESEVHLIPKARVIAVFSNSVKPDCKTLPRQKVNVSIPALKLNLSDRRISMLAEFIHNMPTPKASVSPDASCVDSMIKASISDEELCKHAIIEPAIKELKRIRKSLHCSKEKILVLSKISHESLEKGVLERHQSTSSEHSDDDECEYWARIIDLPGFEDNVSASNSIMVLLRFTIGEIALHLARSSDHVDRPYLMLRAEKLCVDAALMEYGPALQASLHAIQLVDKLHPSSTGEYLELISTVEKTDMITILYRKVKANCPEFKSHFHQVEHSLVLDLTTLSIAFHREAFLTLAKFLQYVWAKLKPRSGMMGHPTLVNFDSFPKPAKLVLNESGDPPVPPGATKFSISARMNALNVRLCDTDINLADLKISGLECDYVLKANEKSVLRLDLSELSLEDLMEETLYSKIISTEEEKVFDIKLVKNSPHHKEIEAKDDQSLPMKVDGSMRIRFGRVVIVLVQSFLNELQRFIDPFLNDTTALLKKSAETKISNQISEIQKSGSKYQLSIDIHAPTFLLPQKPTSPNSLVFNLGDFGIENFFHEVPTSYGSTMHYIDNVLVRLNTFQISRAVILLDGKMEIREPILEPLKLRLDVKRSLAPHHRDILLYEVSGSMDIIKINVGQRDLSTMIAIYQENYSQMKFLHSPKSASSPMSPLNPESPNEESMRKLEVFLYTASDIYKETSFTFIMEGMNIALYNDGEDIQSSCVRDPLQILSCFELDEVKVSVEVCNDKSLELKCSCQAATVIDSRVNSSSPLRKIFQSYSGDSQTLTGVFGISLSMPPMIDLTYRQTSSGDAAVDIVVEKIRLNVSGMYILSLLKFVSDALPGKQRDGYLSKNQLMDHKTRSETAMLHRRLPSDSTSGYHSTTSVPFEENCKALSISAVLRKPEIVLFSGPASTDSEVVVIKLDVTFDYSFNVGQGNFVFSISGLHVLSCVYGRRKQTMFMVLHPCDAEFSKTQKLTEAEVKMIANISNINICLSAPVIHTISSIVMEIIKTTQNENTKKSYKFDVDQNHNTDLWSPVSVTPQKWVESANASYATAPFILSKVSESFVLNVPEFLLFCEVSGLTKRIPMLYAKGAIETEIRDWSSQLSVKGEVKLEATYYNQKISTWEPLLEPVMVTEGHYRPLEIMCKVFRDRSHPIMCHHNDKDWSCDIVDSCDGHHVSAEQTSTSSSSDETEKGDNAAMTVIKRKRLTKMKRISSIAKSRESSSLLAYPVDSDSENEGDDGMLGKIASTFDHLFSSDGESDSEDDEDLSDSEGVADLDGGGARSDSGETETADASATDDDRPPVFFSLPPPSSHRTSSDVAMTVDGGYAYESAIYLTIDCRDPLNFNVTPAAISVLDQVIEDFTSQTMERSHFSCHSEKLLTLKNLLGPETIAKFLKKGDDEIYEIIEEANGRTQATGQSGADVFAPLVDISPPDSDPEMSGDEIDCFNITSALVSAVKKDYLQCNLDKEKCISDLYEEVTKEKLSIDVEGFDKLVCLIPKRTTTAMYTLHPVKNKTRYVVMVGTELYYGHTTLTVYSPLKVENHLSKAVHILCQKSVLEALGMAPEDYSKNPFQEKFIRLTTLDVGQVYNVPLYVAYHCKLFIQPVTSAPEDDEYKISMEGVFWQDVTTSPKNGKYLSCSNAKDGQGKFCVKVVCTENKEVKTPSVGTKLVPNYTLHFYPPIVVHNVLPFSIALHFKETSQVVKLSEGEQLKIFDIEPHRTQELALEVVQYLGIQWHGKLQLSGNQEEHRPVLMSPETDTCGGNRHLSVHVHASSLDAYLFSPYWIINKTGLPLQFRGSSSDAIYEVAATTDPLLFRFKKHRRKKAKLRVYSSHWSRSFSLDTVQNSGVVICTDHERNKKYKFFVNVEMSQILLTKIITIKPYFLVMNNTQNYLRFMEKNDSTDLWFDIAPEKCLPFWPETDSFKMFVKQRDSKVVCQNFPFDKSHVTVLRTEHGSALKVEVKCNEDIPTCITFHPYVQGDAPVKVENFCEDLFLKIHQKCQGQVTLLNPYQSVLYTWDDPVQERTLVWNLYNRKKPGFSARICKDGYGHEKVSFHSLRGKLQPSGSLKSSLEESSSDDDDSESGDGILLPKKTRKDKVVVYWVSYIEQNQRVLLFTQDDRIAREARKAVDGEKSKMECFLSVNSIGLSLMNGAQRELAYFSLNPCPAIWEIEINNTWKLLTLELSAWLEDKWTHDHQRAHLKDYLQVDLTKMHMIKPFFGQLRRFASPALWCQIRKSRYHTYFHTKVHRFQVDNQLPDAVFPTVIHPGPTPQSVVRRYGPKPCLELALLLRKSPDQTVRTVKYLKVLIQNMHVKLDKGFLLSLYDVYATLKTSEPEDLKLKRDLLAIQEPLFNPLEIGTASQSNERTLFEYVHLSPIKIHFSFSPRGTVHKAKPDPSKLQNDVVDFLLNSVGATLSEVKDVELRMAYFERKGVSTSLEKLLFEAKSHYSSQLVQQTYVLVLGLDILGNPYGLVRDFTRGFGEFFYEPFMGSVKSPDEFAESLARGAQSLFGHVVGGSAGAISLITGSMGQALSVLTFDEEYRRKRHQRLQQQDLTLPETLLAATRGFVLGVTLGLSGVFVQPITGAQQEGAEGFFKGIGKGLLGLITKPAGGVMDMLSMALDGLRRAAELGEDVLVRIRLPRYVNPIAGLRPYSPYQASGSRLLQELSKGHYTYSDVYWAHAALGKNDKADVALITDKHVFLLEKCRFWGDWDIEWVVSIEDIMTVPFVNGKNLVIKVKQEDSLLNFAGDERFVHCEEVNVLEWLKERIEKALLFNMREKPCPSDV